MLMCALFLPIAHETAGAARIRHSLRPLFGEGVRIPANLGRNAPRECEAIATSSRPRTGPRSGRRGRDSPWRSGAVEGIGFGNFNRYYWFGPVVAGLDGCEA